MFETQALYYLKKYLGKYVEGVDEQSLRISVLQGDVLLTNLRFRPEALAELDLPITVKAGLLGALNLKVPWSRLGTEPIIVAIDKVYLLVNSCEDTSHTFSHEEFEASLQKMFTAVLDWKRARVAESETKWIQSLDGTGQKMAQSEAENGGFLYNYMQTILANLEIKVTNIHIRYEDDSTTEGSEFSFGLMLSELSAHTVDQQGYRTFVSGKHLQKILKFAILKGFSLYFDPNATPWMPTTQWKDMHPDEWDVYFLTPIKNSIDHKDASKVPFLLKPVNGHLKYHRNRHVKGHSWAEDEPTMLVDLALRDVDIVFSRQQYEHTQNLLTVINLYQRRLTHHDLRPSCRPVDSESAQLWWMYGFLAIKRRYQISASLSYRRIQRIGEIRREYIPSYISHLKADCVGGDERIRELESELEERTILIFRKIAHLRVERAKRAALSAQVSASVGESTWDTWSSWLWGKPAVLGATSEPEETTEDGTFSEDDWEKLTSVVEIEEEKHADDTPYTIKFFFGFHLQSGSLSLVDAEDTAFMQGRLSDTRAAYTFYPKTQSMSFEVAQAVLTCPEGVLMTTEHQSGDKRPAPACTMEYTQYPQDASVAARVKLGTSSTYVMFRPDAFAALTQFLAPIEKVDVSILEAQAVAHFKKARDMAEQQIRESRDRYDIQIRLDAPKLAIPCDPQSPIRVHSTLVVDLGTFYLNSVLDKSAHEAGQQFRLGVSDVTSYLVNTDFSWSTMAAVPEQMATRGTTVDGDPVILPILDRMGIDADVHFHNPPGSLPIVYSCTQGALRLAPKLHAVGNIPQIRFHLSPFRYQAVMSIITTATAPFYEDTSGSPGELMGVDMEGQVSVLIWEGLGNLVPKWKKHTARISNGYFYLENSKNEILRWIWLGDEIEVAQIPERYAFGKRHILALMPRNVPFKRAAENADVVMFALEDGAVLSRWRRQMKASQKENQQLTEPDKKDGLLESVSDEEKSAERSEEGPGFQFLAEGRVTDACVFLYGRPPDQHQLAPPQPGHPVQ